MNRWIAEHACWPLTEMLLRRDTMRRLATLRRTQRFSIDEIHELQRHKLRKLLQRASAHCPYHASRIQQAKIDPHAADVTLDDLQRLPLLNREDIRKHRDAMTWFDCPRGGAQQHNTGGSSGEPLIFYFDRIRQAADWAARWRAREWFGVRPGASEILLWGAPTDLRVQDRLRQYRDALLNQQILNAFDMTEPQMDAYAARIQRVQPACLYGYASSLALIARHILNSRSFDWQAPHRLKAVFVTGEILLEADRRIISEAFRAPVVIEYGSRDAGLIAMGCPEGKLHVMQENVIVELLDQAGQPVPPGQVGEVVITHLETYAMPLIRYRTGDLARRSSTSNCGDACDCGLMLQTLDDIQGRTTDTILCKDNGQIRHMHALALIYVIREIDGIRNFRIVQPDLDHLDVDIVADGGLAPAVCERIRAGLAGRMGDHVDIRIHETRHIQPSASGKHAYVVSHVHLPEHLRSPAVQHT